MSTAVGPPAAGRRRELWLDRRLVELFETDYAIDSICQIKERFHGNRLYADVSAT
jgi:hypothetical protein